LSVLLAALAVRMLLFTDTYMPMYPDRAEKKAPRRKAMPTSNLSPIAMIIPNITLIIAIVLYWRAR